VRLLLPVAEAISRPAVAGVLAAMSSRIVIPPGPGVNPTLAILMVAQHYGEAVAAAL